MATESAANPRGGRVRSAFVTSAANSAVVPARKTDPKRTRSVARSRKRDDAFSGRHEPLLNVTRELGGSLLDPLKSTVVHEQRSMGTWVGDSSGTRCPLLIISTTSSARLQVSAIHHA